MNTPKPNGKQQPPSATEVTCPICLEEFADPVLVCPSHHTLCRACYQEVAARDARCPECRQLMTRPVENATARCLVSAKRKLEQPSCQADGSQGPAAAASNGGCEGGPRQLLYSKQRRHLEADCQRTIAKAAASVARVDKAHRAIDIAMDAVVEGLERRRAAAHAQVTSAGEPLAKRLRADAEQLRDLLAAGQLGTAVALLGDLAEALERSERVLKNVKIPILPASDV